MAKSILKISDNGVWDSELLGFWTCLTSIILKNTVSESGSVSVLR
jgi:hypothetical protein